MTGKVPGKSNESKRENNERNNHNNNGGRSGGCKGNNGRGERGRGRGGRGVRGSSNIDHFKTIECFQLWQKGHYFTDCSSPRKNDNENSNMVSKADFKNLFQSFFKDMLTKK
jgi:hypothetical protein